jgi:uncharacterized linocin/CFP29 family protein
MLELNWTEDQQHKIKQAIDDEIENSRLAHRVIPEHSLSPADRTVARDTYIYGGGLARDAIDEAHDDLDEVSMLFSITKLQAEDADLANASTRVRRAAQQLALSHDEAVFRTTIRNRIDANQGKDGIQDIVNIPAPISDGIVAASADAVARLDAQGYRSGYVLIAGQEIYTQLHTRSPGQADLPVKAVTGILEGGPVHRSSVLPANEAILLSISGAEIDRAVAIRPALEFQRIGDNTDRELRLYERFLTRFKQTLSAVLLRS